MRQLESSKDTLKLNSAVQVNLLSSFDGLLFFLLSFPPDNMPHMTPEF